MKSARHPSHSWAQFIKNVRTFFEGRCFLEVFTPYLVPVGAFENALDPLKVQFNEGTCDLHTSPEIAMKVLLAQENKSIYQICKCFRDDPDTSIHFKEFTMLEFYRVHCDYLTTRQDMKDFITTLSGQSVSFKEISVEAAFHTYANIALADMASAALFLNEARRIGIYSLTESDSWEDIFFRIMMERIEPALPPQTPTLIYDYPASVSTLSQPKGKHWGERFEIYWHQMELCNGATELIDSSVLKNRYEFEKQERIKAGKEPHPFPRTLFEVIDRLPPCSGVAVGLDRLFWALNSTNTPNSI